MKTQVTVPNELEPSVFPRWSNATVSTAAMPALNA
jgi:hypothetical protein